MNNNGWNEYQKMVLDALDRHQKSLDDVHKELVSNKERIAELRVKSRVWGAISGGLAGLTAVLGKTFMGN